MSPNPYATPQSLAYIPPSSITILHDAYGNIIFSFNAQKVVWEILQCRDVLRAVAEQRGKGVRAEYEKGCKELVGEVAKWLEIGEEGVSPGEMAEDMMQTLFHV
jgi:hypothetical protein